MAEAHASFVGSIPDLYERHLGPLFFEPYARDLIGRADWSGVSRVLELASGARYQYRPDGSPVADGISAGHALAADLAAGRLGRVTGLHGAPRDLVAARGVGAPTDAFGDLPGVATTVHDLPVSAPGVSWLARRLLERRAARSP